MGEMRDGFAFLESLRQKDREALPSFSSFVRYLDGKARLRGVPLTGQFELTPLCNFRCRMCYVQMTGSQLPQPVLPPETWKALMSQAVQAGMLRATLTGGECLAYPGFDEVYEHLRSLGCELTVMTNAALLDGERIAYFLRHRPGSVCVTLYGDSESAYERVTGQRAFETVVRNLRAARDAGLPLEVTVTPSTHLGEDVFGTLRLAKELTPAVRVNPWLSSPRPETGRSGLGDDPDQDMYIRIMRYRNELNGYRCTDGAEGELPEPGGPLCGSAAEGLLCSAGRSAFSVMNPCFELDMIQAFPLRDGFDAAWHQIHEAAEHWPRASDCDGCAYASLCVRCAGRLLKYAQPGIRPAELCRQTMEFVRQGVYRMPECD